MTTKYNQKYSQPNTQHIISLFFSQFILMVGIPLYFIKNIILKPLTISLGRRRFTIDWAELIPLF